jgi:hypothetical protein
MRHFGLRLQQYGGPRLLTEVMISRFAAVRIVQTSTRMPCAHESPASGVKAAPDAGLIVHWPLFSGLFVRQRFHAGQLLAFEELEACSAAGGDVGDLVGQSGLVDGRN